MLNPSLNHRSLGAAGAFLVCAATICLTLPLAAAFAQPEEPRPVAPRAVTPPAPPAAPAAVAPVPVAPKPAAAVAVKPPSKPRPVAVQPQGRADGGLSGTVLDASGAVVPGVQVIVCVVETVPGFGTRENPVAVARTNAAGGFSFPALVPGPYALKAELPGFAPYRKSGIQIRPSQTNEEKIFLSLGNTVERVQVVAAGQPRPPAPAAGLRPIRVGGNVSAPRLISQVKPVYPANVRDAGIEGIVHLQAIITADGSLMATRVMSSNNRDLAAAALEAVRQWRYLPAMLNGEPIETQTEIDVAFSLAQ